VRQLGAIRKMYAADDAGGQSQVLWDHAWHDVDLDYELKRLGEGHDALVRLVTEHAPRSGPVLEAGSGSGRVLAHLRRVGCHAVGTDFAVEALLESKRRAPDLPVAAGDICRLPFGDEKFAGVVSLGLIEHFEEGPAVVLSEHRRVLRRGGLLLISVPRLSPVKAWNDRRSLRRGREYYESWRGLTVRRPQEVGLDPSALGSGASTFYQYEVTDEVLKRWLHSSGFRILEMRSTSLALGLREIGLVRRGFERFVAHRLHDLRASPSSGQGRDGVGGGARSRLYDRSREIVAAERGHNALERAVVRVLQALSGHMLFAVARRES